MTPAQHRDPRPHPDPEALPKHLQAITEAPKGLLQRPERIDWERFGPLLEEVAGYAQRDWSQGGQPPIDPLLMFNILLLQAFHKNLSDEETENKIRGHIPYLRFLGLNFGEDIPQAKPIGAFQERLEENAPQVRRRLLEAFGTLLQEKGRGVREGRLIDASFIQAPRQRNSAAHNKAIQAGERPDEFDANPAVGR